MPLLSKNWKSFTSNKLHKKWKTPLTKDIQWSVSSDYAKAQYTRGMVLTEDYIIAGSSPARVDVYNLEHNTAIISVEISKDIRVSVCGMTKYEW